MPLIDQYLLVSVRIASATNLAADQLEGCAHSSESINNHICYAARSQLCIRGLIEVHQAPIFRKIVCPSGSRDMEKIERVRPFSETITKF